MHQIHVLLFPLSVLGYNFELYFSVFVIRDTELNWAEEEVLDGGKTLLTFQNQGCKQTQKVHVTE